MCHHASSFLPTIIPSDLYCEFTKPIFRLASCMPVSWSLPQPHAYFREKKDIIPHFFFLHLFFFCVFFLLCLFSFASFFFCVFFASFFFWLFIDLPLLSRWTQSRQLASDTCHFIVESCASSSYKLISWSYLMPVFSANLFGLFLFKLLWKYPW